MKPGIIRLFFLLIFLFSGTTSKPGSQGPFGTPVDIVFCLDLSGSTNGIIDRMRNHIWDYVNLFSQCTPRPDYRIGFVGFARPSFGKDNYYVKVIADLTHDIEGLTNELLKLRTQIEKGDQFVGPALKVCGEKISWSDRPEAVKVLFLGGNGLVTTGSEPYTKAVETCVARGIIVNCVYILNNPVVGEQAGWEDIAARGNGKYTSMQVKFEYFENLGGFSMDKLFALNKQLNETYLYYGPIGKERSRIQRAIDESIYKANSEGYRYRLQFRISDLYLYKNATWDLVDLHSKNPAALATIDRDLLSDTLKYLTDPDLRAQVIFNKGKRNKVIADIRKMLAEKEQMMKDKNLVADKNMKTFDITTIKWLTDILLAKGFVISE
jgi:hypothetical protein